MGRNRKRVEKPFVSIEEDAKLLGMEVHHAGMSREAALELVRDIDGLGLNLDVIEILIPGTGHKRYEREHKNHPALAAERYYTIEDARYHVRVTQDDKAILLENRQQWELYRRLYLGDASVSVRIKKSDYDDISRLFEAETGIELDSLLQTDEIEETEEIEVPLEEHPTEFDLLELALDDYDTSLIG